MNFYAEAIDALTNLPVLPETLLTEIAKSNPSVLVHAIKRIEKRIEEERQAKIAQLEKKRADIDKIMAITVKPPQKPTWEQAVMKLVREDKRKTAVNLFRTMMGVGAEEAKKGIAEIERQANESNENN